MRFHNLKIDLKHQISGKETNSAQNREQNTKEFATKSGNKKPPVYRITSG